ncbi:MAG TPA: hypothetical protein VNY83_03635 [Solirubrobacterales bacterium]|jgi:hypothetical protein|nr:hypothetical protein [Solirubrobacterales bacterium]
MRKLLLIFAALALLAPAPATAGAYVPPGFIGVSPQSTLSGGDFELMQEAGIQSVRLPMSWSSIQPENPSVKAPDWAGFDREVGLAAEHRIRIFPFLCSTPSWVASRPTQEPVETAWQRWGWSRFLRAAVARYGPEGSFWEENPELPFMPIRRWEIWNEENLVTFSHNPDPARYARLMRLSGRVLHEADPGSKAIVGGLFGRPLQTPPNVQSGVFLSQLYRSRRVKQYFDGVALHPYVAEAGAMRAQIENLRRIMRVHHDASTPIYVTELGWGSANGPTRWQRGLYGQAEELDQALAMLSANRLSWRIAGVWWFSWTDRSGACQFCDSAGLLTAAREAKPAWYSFNAWTGGNPDTVPRAQFLAR